MAERALSRVTTLYHLAQQSGQTSRNALVAKIADLYFAETEDLSVRERELVVDILMELARTATIAIRAELSLRLATEPLAPPELVRTLARDDEVVARPLLLHSMILDDPELIDIIKAHGAAHQLAIARRPRVSEALAEALIEAGHPEVATAVVSNPGAQLSEAMIERLAHTACTYEPLQEPLLGRPELTAETASRLYWWASQDLRRDIMHRFSMPAAQLDRALELTIQHLVETAKARREITPDQEIMADRLAAAGSITAPMLIHLLRRGQPNLFQLLFGRLAQLDAGAVQMMVAQPGGEAMALACKALRVEKGSFASLFLLSRAARPGDQSVDPRELSRVLALYDRLNTETAGAVLQGWQADSAQLLRLAQRRMADRPR